VSFLVLQYAVVEKVVGIPLAETLRDAIPALVCGLALLATAWAGVQLLDDAWTDLAVLLVAGTAASAVYALALRLLFPSTWRDLTLLAGGLRPG
jgi:hypothetical protein